MTPGLTAAPRLAVVTVTYGAPELLDSHLARLVLPTGSEVVVVDNLATPELRGQIEQRCTLHQWRFVPMPGNAGFGAAVNRGVALAQDLGCTAFLVLNPDALPDPGVVPALLADLEADPLAVLAPALVHPDGRPQFAGAALDPRWGRARAAPHFDGTADGDWLSAACLLIGSAAWQRCGGFDERYFMYWEDVDLGRRVTAAGGRLRLRPDLLARHDVGATQRTGARQADAAAPPAAPSSAPTKSSLYVYYNCRNRLLYGALHLDRPALLRWIVATPRESWVLLARAGRREVLHSRALRRAAVRGSFAGLRIAVAALRRPGTIPIAPSRAGARSAAP